MTEPVAVVLAAGKGTRMKSDRPKVLHAACGRSLVAHVLDAARAAGARRTIVVVGYRADEVRAALAGEPGIEFAVQSEQSGTGHAVMMCAEALAGHAGPVLVLAGDTPLVRAETLAALLADQRESGAACVIGTARTAANEGLGRIVRDGAGEFVKIVEQRDATPQERAIQEVNTGCYVFDGPALLEALGRLRPDNAQAEYYLTDCPALLKAQGRTVVASCRLDIAEALGVNTPEQLAEVERALGCAS
ncbi:MAG: NTP transferase domain-containing protein [Planctomycetales bacterium]